MHCFLTRKRSDLNWKGKEKASVCVSCRVEWCILCGKMLEGKGRGRRSHLRGEKGGGRVNKWVVSVLFRQF